MTPLLFTAEALELLLHWIDLDHFSTAAARVILQMGHVGIDSALLNMVLQQDNRDIQRILRGFMTKNKEKIVKPSICIDMF